MPALDFDTTGNLVVTFYDRRDDPGNFLYHVYMVRINSNGGNLQPNTRISTFQSDARSYSSGSYQRFIGDYQDIWDQVIAAGGEYYFPVWVGIPSGSGYCSNSPSTSCTINANCPSGGTCIINGDIYVSGILP